MANSMLFAQSLLKKLEREKEEAEKPPERRGHSPESRRLISEALRGHSVSKLTRLKISAKLSGVGHPMFGKKHSEEARRKMSEAAKRRKKTKTAS